MTVLVGDAPTGVADVIVGHHAVPLTSREYLVVIIGEALVFFHQVADGKAVAHCSSVVHHSNTG